MKTASEIINIMIQYNIHKLEMKMTKRLQREIL